MIRKNRQQSFFVADSVARQILSKTRDVVLDTKNDAQSINLMQRALQENQDEAQSRFDEIKAIMRTIIVTSDPATE